jgi:N-methylhydantoinase A/acetophenone carboxylase
VVRAPSAGPDPDRAARLPSRKAYWSGSRDPADTPVFSFPELRPGNRILGPALVEAPDTTFVIEPGWKFTLDEFHNGLLERLEQAPS